MSLSKLTAEEDLALLGLLREVIRADGEYSATEQAEMQALRDEIGEARFGAAVEAAKARFTSLAALKEHAASIEGADARTAILGRLIAVASSDGISEGEDKPLLWLARVWPDAAIRPG